MALSEVFTKGGEGGVELAEAVFAVLELKESKFKVLYELDLSIEEKIEKIAKEIYGADGVNYDKAAQVSMKKYVEMGYGNLPICRAKTQYSLTDDATRLGTDRFHNHSSSSAACWSRVSRSGYWRYYDHARFTETTCGDENGY